MKSYFAKLAARATLANTPASPSVTTSTTQDPFAEETVPNTASSPLGPVQPTHGPTQSVQTSRSQPLTKGEEVSRSRAERIDFPTGEEKERRSTSLTDQVVLAPTVQRPAEISREQNPDTKERGPHLEFRETKPESPQASPQPVSQEKIISQLMPPAILKEASESKPANNADVDPQLDEMKREQAVLLRKADAFMTGLFERRSSEATQREADSEDKENSSAVVSHEQSPLPLPKGPPVIEVADEQPSLVIGKLTVEVTPPAPPPVTPAPQVIVVRGRGTRRQGGGFSSSQRFGLGQF